MGLVIGLCVINIGLMAFVLFRTGPPPHPGGMRPEDRPRQLIIEKIGFDQQQVTQYDQLITEHRTTVRKLEAQIMEAKNNLYHTLVENTSAKDSIINGLTSLQQRVETTHYNHFLDIKKICRADQQDEFNQLTTELADYFRPHKPR